MADRRRLLRQHWIVAMTIVVMALLTRMLIPTGYMPMVENGRFVIVLCAEQNPGMAAMATMPGMVSGMAHMDATPADASHDHGMAGHAATDHAKDSPCGFGGLALAALAATDPLLLALALLFLLATVFRRPERPVVCGARFLWPPRTGPPVVA